MKPTTVFRDAFTIIGVSARGNPREIDYKALWARRFMPREAELNLISIEAGHYGASFTTDERGVIEHIAAMVVNPNAQVPEGMTKREIPGGSYAVFDCTMAIITQTYGYIYGQWAKNATPPVDETRPDFEFYPSGSSDDPDSPLEIWVPVMA
jgi:predicted transcriptional regulator YdeE